MAMASSDAELERLIQRDIERALKIAERKALEDMFEAVGRFYASGDPKKYQRTGALMNTPKTRNINNNSFEAYLDDSGHYTTGKRPSMGQVLELTNEGSLPGFRPAVGASGYWSIATKKIQADFEIAMSQFFTKGGG